MAVSFVNGFYCESSCDVAKAKKGQDPHPGTHTADAHANDKQAAGASRADGRTGRRTRPDCAVARRDPRPRGGVGTPRSSVLGRVINARPTSTIRCASNARS